jgi:hypothetical protein
MRSLLALGWALVAIAVAVAPAAAANRAVIKVAPKVIDLGTRAVTDPPTDDYDGAKVTNASDRTLDVLVSAALPDDSASQTFSQYRPPSGGSERLDVGARRCEGAIVGGCVPLRDTSPMPSFLDAYLVAENSRGAPPVGAVRKDGHVWRILQFGIPADQQSQETFATRREAGAKLIELSGRR